jgi:hypothetical protein
MGPRLILSNAQKSARAHSPGSAIRHIGKSTSEIRCSHTSQTSYRKTNQNRALIRIEPSRNQFGCQAIDPALAHLNFSAPPSTGIHASNRHSTILWAGDRCASVTLPQELAMPFDTLYFYCTHEDLEIRIF